MVLFKKIKIFKKTKIETKAKPNLKPNFALPKLLYINININNNTKPSLTAFIALIFNT